ncbi:MAG: oxygen-independent coproporphyrinogen III oxidase-like protein, partial [Gammaproteobacteria bacterium]
QTPDEAIDDLDAAISERPAHLSRYQLTIEPNTAFAAEPPDLPSDDASWDIRCAVQERAQAAGFQHYEVSAFARPGRECHHNLNYWQFGDYLGIGAGAHSKLTLGSGIHRWHRPRHPKAYVESMAQPSTPQIGCALETADRTFEFLLNALRLKEGFHPNLFRERTGMDWPFESDEVQGAISDGLLHCSSEQIRTTALGWRFLDELLQGFLKP